MNNREEGKGKESKKEEHGRKVSKGDEGKGKETRKEGQMMKLRRREEMKGKERKEEEQEQERMKVSRRRKDRRGR